MLAATVSLFLLTRISVGGNYAETVLPATIIMGVGLGLVFAREIIDAHGGRLWAEAHEPRGTIFQFTLPAAERELNSRRSE